MTTGFGAICRARGDHFRPIVEWTSESQRGDHPSAAQTHSQPRPIVGATHPRSSRRPVTRSEARFACDRAGPASSPSSASSATATAGGASAATQPGPFGVLGSVFSGITSLVTSTGQALFASVPNSYSTKNDTASLLNVTKSIGARDLWSLGVNRQGCLGRRDRLGHHQCAGPLGVTDCRPDQHQRHLCLSHRRVRSRHRHGGHHRRPTTRAR